jgi:NAD(P)-dependent dehydrogenase (short-subunit alcohol dehydrogenase family)
MTETNPTPPTTWEPGRPLLDGKVALVAGAGRGIGEATARLLAAAGAAVAVVDLEEDRARAVRDAIMSAGGRAVPVVADVRDEAQSDAIVDAAVSTFGGLDVLVNVAGGMNVFGNWAPLTEWSSDQWDAVVGLNLRYHFLLCRSAIPRLAERGGGAIVNITSVSGVFGAPNHAAYGAAKAGLIHLTKTLALEVGRLGIRVNAVSPGAVFTPATADRLTPERREEMQRTTPLQRAGAPDDIARAVLFFASPMADYVTGQMLLVDGGVAAKFPLHAPGADVSEAHQ